MEEAVQDHDHNLTQPLQRTWEMNLKLNKDKVKLRLTSITYMGHILTAEVQQMPPPTDARCDASDKRLGAAFLQKGQDIAFASRTLIPTEQGYAQIEKKCQAIVFACDCFDQYLQGRHSITVRTDHKPLEVIFKKHILSAPK